MKKIRKIGIWIGVIVYMIMAFSFINIKQDKVICHNLDVIILDSMQNRFIDEDDVRGLLIDNNINSLGYPIEEINTKTIEKVLGDYKSIKNAEAFLTIDGILHILISQRQPIVRVMNKDNVGYYIDIEGKVIPLSKDHTSFVLLANGHINEPFRINENINILDECNETSAQGNTMLQLYNIAKFIYNNAFWKAQIEQIYVTDKGEFELIPRVGAHIIILGSGDDFLAKFRKLKIFYDQGLNVYGWNNYEIINLQYKDQVVCTKR